MTSDKDDDVGTTSKSSLSDDDLGMSNATVLSEHVTASRNNPIMSTSAEEAEELRKIGTQLKYTGLLTSSTILMLLQIMMLQRTSTTLCTMMASTGIFALKTRLGAFKSVRNLQESMQFLRMNFNSLPRMSLPAQRSKLSNCTTSGFSTKNFCPRMLKIFYPLSHKTRMEEKTGTSWVPSCMVLVQMSIPTTVIQTFVTGFF